MSSNLAAVASMLILGSLVCGFGAWYANNYTQYINTGIFGTITRKPYQQYVFPLSFSAVLLFVVGVAAAVAAPARPKRIVLKPVSAMPVEIHEKCPHCGSQLTLQCRYCPNCGQIVKRESWISIDGNV